MSLFDARLIGEKPPAIAGGQWFNASHFPPEVLLAREAGKPLLITQDLPGKAVLIFFWDYECADCVAALPHLNAWWKKFHDRDFFIIGIHTPEFEFAKDLDKVESAILRSSISYPVVNDADYESWKAYGCSSWPRLLLVDRQGIVQYDHSGKVNQKEVEEKIGDLMSG